MSWNCIITAASSARTNVAIQHRMKTSTLLGFRVQLALSSTVFIRTVHGRRQEFAQGATWPLPSFPSHKRGQGLLLPEILLNSTFYAKCNFGLYVFVRAEYLVYIYPSRNPALTRFRLRPECVTPAVRRCRHCKQYYKQAHNPLAHRHLLKQLSTHTNVRFTYPLTHNQSCGTARPVVISIAGSYQCQKHIGTSLAWWHAAGSCIGSA